MASCNTKGQFSNNPKAEIEALLCDIPSQWRDPVVEALNCALNMVLRANVDVVAEGNCEGIQNCQTNTQFTITLVDNILTAHYVNEKNITIIRNTDLTDAINNALDAVDPKCLMTQEEWDALTYQERLNAIFNKACCVHNDCAGVGGSGCGCVDCGDEDAECIGLEACPCVTYEVTGTAPFIFSYKDCETKVITEFESLEADLVQICAIRGTVITPVGVFCNQILDECSDEPITTTTTSTTTTTTETTTTTSTSTTTTTTEAPETTTTTSTTTTTTESTTTTSTTTTSTSTTTTTTAAPFAYYLADEYLCEDCSLWNSGILVKLPSGHTVQVGKYYIPTLYAGLIYVLDSTPQAAGGSVSLTTSNFTTCGAICGRAVDATFSSGLSVINHCSEPDNTVYTDDGTISTGKTVYIDITLTTPLTGYDKISDSNAGQVYDLDSGGGFVGSFLGSC